MAGEGSDLAAMLNRMLGMIANEVNDLDDDVINRALPFQPANTIYQLAFHVAGSTRWWSITNTGGTDFRRDRAAEFVSSGSVADLVEHYASLRAQVEQHVTGLTASDLEREIVFPEATISHYASRTPLSQRDVVLHAIEHAGIHLGHIQLTRQVFGISPRSDWE